MGKIHALDQDTINQIAAGEVIDRPVSVVKELTENAIDAGATAITVEIKQGGISLIRVTDNGGGIASEDLSAAFQRHTTSKITKALDLLTVSSLGFRGEALSSIAAVSRVELITRTHSSLIGNRYIIEGGEEKEQAEVGTPEGTTILVRDLFYNTPARRKFLKTPATEGSYIHDMISKMALSRPDISFRLLINGQSRLHTSGNHNLKDVIYQIYGRDLTKELIPVRYSSSFFRMEGFIGKPLISRSSRSYEIYFINGRYIRSSLIHKAIEEGYRNFLMQHKFPMTVLNLIIDPEFTDVNVHPSKMELRFRNQEFLYEGIVHAVRKTLTSGELSHGFTVETPDPADKSSGRVTETMNPADESSGCVPEKTGPAAQNRKERPEKPPEPFEKKRLERLIREEQTSYEAEHGNSSGTETGEKGSESSFTLPEEPKSPLPSKSPKKSAEMLSESLPSAKSGEEKEKQGEAKEVLSDAQIVDVRQRDLFEDKILTADTLSQIRLAGQIFDTYWVVQYQDLFLIIDQHAAHEKVLYESIIGKLKEQDYTTQQMNPPLIITLTPKQQERMEEIAPVLARMGFETEPFGGNEYAVYGMPDNLVGISPVDLLDEILESGSEKGTITPDAVYEKAASLACKSAIKGNQHISEEEALHLIADLVELENPYTCPHGRPTMIRMTKYELEKKFKRVL